MKTRPLILASSFRPSLQFYASKRQSSVPKILTRGALQLSVSRSSSSSDGNQNRGNRIKRGRNNNRSRPKKNRRIFTPPPPPGQHGRECHRSCIQIGSEVFVVQKMDQRSGKKTKGVVSRLLTRVQYHPRGIKVMLDDGTVGRVCKLLDDGIACDEMNGTENEPISLSKFLIDEDIDGNLSNILMNAATACSQISKELRLLSLSGSETKKEGNINIQGEEQKGMDVISNEIFKQQLKPTVVSMVSEEEENILPGDETSYAVAFDPLDGSSNLDVAAPTGSIFGIYRYDNVQNNPFKLPPRQSLVAAGYTVYSSAVELVIAGVDFNTIGFTLDDANTFRCSRSQIICPDSGPYYSLNEAREPDWPDGLRRWVYDAKRGGTPSGIKYSARYVCSLTADVHRTLLKGGWAGNPRPHLRLLYEAAPLAFIAEKSGGAGSDGGGHLLDIKPTSLHQRVCCFIGSKLDIKELLQYGDIQQTRKTYET